mgnify:CR=1 FL=1
MKNDHTLSQTDLIEQKIQEISEYDFTQSILIPLFKALGYSKVDYTGGPYENGKDIICWGKDKFDNIDLMVCQVKKYKPTARASDKKSFMEIVNQLQQASEKEIPNIDGQAYKPNEVCFVTPYQVDNRALMARFEKYKELSSQRVKILDGQKIIDLCLLKIPTQLNKILGIKSTYNSIINKLNNADLMSALCQEGPKDISEYYSSQDFGISKVSLKVTLEMDFKPIIQTYLISFNEWEEFVKLCTDIKKIVNIDIVCQSIDAVNITFIKEKSRQDFFKKSLTKFTATKAIIENSIDTCYNKLRELIVSLNKHITQKVDDSYFLQSLLKLSQCLNNLRTIVSENKQCVELPTFYELLKNFEKNLSEISFYDKTILSELNLFAGLMRKYNINFRIIKTITNKIKRKNLNITIDTVTLIDTINNNKRTIFRKIDDFKKNRPCIDETKEFFELCINTLTLINILNSHKFTKKCLDIPKGRSCTLFYNTRTNLSIFDAFNTRLDLLVLGEAGAGKTTCLQMYMLNKIKSSDDRFYIYYPLSKFYAAKAQSKLAKTQPVTVDSLEDCICQYYSSMGCDLNKHDLRLELQRQSTLLLDGIDEVVKTIPDISGLIFEIKNRYPTCQIITSSRSSGNYLDNIPFICITLLPFTSKQRNSFINNWFKNDPEKSIHIIEHLKLQTEVANIVSNPLLTTILCVLAENNIPLPDSEIRLYNQRVELLLGMYDVHKKIKRLHSQRHHLQDVAQKLAYGMHSLGIREVDEKRAINLIEHYSNKSIEKSVIKTAFTELIDPCNILTITTDSGKFSFGHLRFQEFFAACELCQNRSIGLGQLLEQPWWEGVIILFAKMTSDIRFVLNWAIHNGKEKMLSSILNRMITVRPVEERQALFDYYYTLSSSSLMGLNVGPTYEDISFIDDVE